MRSELLLKIAPYLHQIQTVDVYRKTPAVLNGSQMGTGKTLPVVMQCLDTGGKCLIVAPASLCLNWVEEFKKCCYEVPHVYPDTGRITIISVDRVHKAPEVFKDVQLIAVDECQNLSNIRARRTKAFHQYVKANLPEKIILLSGTPMRNRVPELYSLFLILDYVDKKGFAAQFPNQWIFNYKYTIPNIKRFGSRQVTSFDGIKNVHDLKTNWLEGRYLKYLLEDLNDIPDMVHCDVTCNVDHPRATEIDAALTDGWETISFGSTIPDKVMSSKLASAGLKVDYTVAFCQDLIDQGNGPLVIFSDHIEPANRIAAAFGCPVITGETPLPERQRIVNAFQTGEIPVVVGTIGAMGTGWTLTKSHICVFNDRSYIPTQNHQAAGRIRRIGQKSKCVVYTISRQGIDRKIAALLLEKEKTINAVFS